VYKEATGFRPGPRADTEFFTNNIAPGPLKVSHLTQHNFAGSYRSEHVNGVWLGAAAAAMAAANTWNKKARGSGIIKKAAAPEFDARKNQ